MLWGEHEIELEGRIRELLGCMSWEGLVSNKVRKKVDRLQRHRFTEVALLAKELLLEDDFQRQISKARRNRELPALSRLSEHYELWVDRRIDRLGPELTLRFE